MRQRILLAEESDTIRGVAESLIRQGGYELISVSEGNKVLEILEFTKPDLMIVASDLKGKGNKAVFEFIEENPRLSDIPMFVLSNPNETGLPFREEVILPKPFEPKDFMAKIHRLLPSGQPAAQPQKVHAQAADDNPLTSGDLNDDILDAALGLDQIEVTESEDMNQTKTSIKTGSKGKSEKLIGFDIKEADTEQPSDSGKVESLMIREDKDEISPNETGKTKQEQPQSSTGKLEILDDQYGLVDPSTLNSQDDNPDHDYNWFLDELKKDTEELENPGANKQKNLNESQKLTFEEPSSSLEPSTPVQQKNNASGGVDKFIDEFKKEVEKISSETPESITLNETQTKADTKENMVWQDSVEQLNPETMQLFTRQLVSELAEKLADKIAVKIDSDKLLAMIKAEIVNRMKK